MKIVRRYGTTPAQRGSASGANCPDIFQLDTGDYLIIGKYATPWARAEAALAEHGASIGEDETAVIVPADVLHAAAVDIAAECVGPA